MRVPLLLAALALVCLALSRPAQPGDAAEARARVEGLLKVPEAELSLAEFRAAGRQALLDPALTLPHYHRLPHATAKALRAYEATCDAAHLAGLDPVAKAVRWAHHQCAGTAPAPAFFDRPPFMHPSGRSYRALAGQPGGHVSEGAHPILSALDRPALRGLHRRSRVVVSSGHVLLATGGDTYATWSRRALDRRAHTEGLRLARRPAPACLVPAGEWCWAATEGTPYLRPAGVVLLALALLIALIGRWRSAARARAEQTLTIRTLSHELRTPAAALTLELGLLRQDYERLPEALQAPLLRASEEVARLERALAVSARYLRLERGEASTRPRDFELSAWLHAELEGLEVEIEARSLQVRTDPEALATCLHNLVANAEQHGRGPIRVRASNSGRWLRLAVEDAGALEAPFTRLSSPFRRGEQSRGLGLGLAITEHLARALGGRLTHRAAPNTFELRIPRRLP